MKKRVVFSAMPDGFFLLWGNECDAGWERLRLSSWHGIFFSHSSVFGHQPRNSRPRSLARRPVVALFCRRLPRPVIILGRGLRLRPVEPSVSRGVAPTCGLSVSDKARPGKSRIQTAPKPPGLGRTRPRVPERPTRPFLFSEFSRSPRLVSQAFASGVGLRAVHHPQEDAQDAPAAAGPRVGFHDPWKGFLPPMARHQLKSSLETYSPRNAGLPSSAPHRPRMPLYEAGTRTADLCPASGTPRSRVFRRPSRRKSPTASPSRSDC